MHAVGTRYSNSTIGDFATDRLCHGFQVFVQEGTGRESFIDPRSDSLCGVEIAESRRAAIVTNLAPEMLAALNYLKSEGWFGHLEKLADTVPGSRVGDELRQRVADIRALLDRANAT